MDVTCRVGEYKKKGKLTRVFGGGFLRYSLREGHVLGQHLEGSNTYFRREGLAANREHYYFVPTLLRVD